MKRELSPNLKMKQRRETNFLCPDCGEGLFGARKKYGLRCKNPDCDVHVVRYDEYNRVEQVWRSTIPISISV